MDASVRAAVMKRADGKCEACGKWKGEALTYDHAHSRREPDAVETGWALCWDPCHAAKTRNDPSAQWWIRRFIEHCEKHGYETSASRSRVRLEVQIAKFGIKP